MKNFILYAVILLLITLLVIQWCKEPEVIKDDTREKELLQDIQQLKVDNKTLINERDSLLKIPPKIKTQIVIREREIDENIAKDSSRAIVEFRRSLQDNNFLPDATEYPTLRELGISSKLMARVPKLELQVRGYDEIVLKDNEIISNLNFQVKANEDLREIQKLAILNCERQLEDATSFWNSKELWFGLGVIGTTAIVFLTGLAK